MKGQRAVDGDALDARVAAVLDGNPVPDGDETLAAARAAVDVRDDRWYGRLAVAARDSVLGEAGDEAERDGVAAAATGVELVRGYCRLRADLLSALRGESAVSLAADRSTALLAGDYLHAAAFQCLHSVPVDSTPTCVEALTGALGSVPATLADARDCEGSGGQSQQLVVDGTAGCVGGVAATLGGVVAAADDCEVDALAAAGRALATVHATASLLDAEDAVTLVPAHAVEEARLRAAAHECQESAARALASLPASVDADELEALASRSGLTV
jgi:hypothetical protein